MSYPQPPQQNPYAQGPPAGYPQGAYGVPAQAYYGPAPVPMAPTGQPLAGFGARLGAYLIDAIVFVALSMVVIIPAMFAMIAWIGTQASQLETDPVTGELVSEPNPTLFVGPIILGYVAIFAVMFGLSYVYYVELFPSRRGVTLGKRALGLTLVRLDDPSAPITRGVAAKRWLMQYVVAMFVPFFSWVDGLWQLWDKPFQQCLHDKVAQTVVVKVNR
ncbi:RDD family protein [Dactylosporangium aurantiacum]|uniref:RDD family protein n=1 Tax=Dactylosporangium aurantiacum TaxID=35754 RepID=A0A9Q9IIW5_9ACTN|nr:RDD family protein [Dactylosporangium aurantiacum]MDG6100970.1 RDD family protein [Dactylosporangium aurantiacum]UWZ54980.1 RDD family protein [Dactylosporangium aurantiacum]